MIEFLRVFVWCHLCSHAFWWFGFCSYVFLSLFAYVRVCVGTIERSTIVEMLTFTRRDWCDAFSENVYRRMHFSTGDTKIASSTRWTCVGRIKHTHCQSVSCAITLVYIKSSAIIRLLLSCRQFKHINPTLKSTWNRSSILGIAMQTTLWMVEIAHIRHKCHNFLY